MAVSVDTTGTHFLDVECGLKDQLISSTAVLVGAAVPLQLYSCASYFSHVCDAKVLVSQQYGRSRSGNGREHSAVCLPVCPSPHLSLSSFLPSLSVASL